MAELTLPAVGPGPLLDLKSEYVVPSVYHFYRDPPQIVAGHGCTLVDHEGREYIDAYAGVTVMSAGHGNPAIIEPAIEQIRTLQHTTTIYITEPQLRLAEALAAFTPDGLVRSFFCASGSEAVEAALLLAVNRTGRSSVVSFTDSLHGRTRWAMNATGLPMWRTDPFPAAADHHHVPFGEIEPLAELLSERGGEIAAVIGEPVQGNGGIVVPPDSFWPEVRRLCDAHGVLLVFDEVQTGFNRTGRWFACEHWDVAPDVICLSKAMGNGFPIAAVVATEDVAGGFTRPGASTYGGNPVSATAALATLNFHLTHELDTAARERGMQLMDGLNRLADRHPDRCAAPRGLGLMIGMPVVAADGAPSAAGCDELLEGLLLEGVLAGKAGPDRNILTFMPPLTITAVQIGRVLDALEHVVA